MTDSVKPREFVQQLWMDLKAPGACRSSPWEGYARYTFDFTHMHLSLDDHVPVLLWERLTADMGIEAYTQFAQDLNRFATRTNAFCLGVTGALVADRLRQPLGDDPAEDFAVIDGEVVRRYMAENDSMRRLSVLAHDLVRQVGVLKLSPYALDVPAEGGRFFGRQQILGKILASRDKSFTIIGPRRIGKTSVLKQVKRRLERQYAESDSLRTAWVTCVRYKDSAEVVSDILKGFYQKLTEREALRLDSRKVRIHSFPSLIARMARGQKRIAVFIDEVDYIVEMDEKQGYECLSLLKAAFDYPNCQVFFAGFRSASRARLDNRTPLYGFTQFEELRPLNNVESKDMIRRPFLSLGLKLPDVVVEKITHESGGHPQVITLFCDTVLNLYHANRRLPTDAEMQRDVFNGREFQQKVMDTFIMNTNDFEELFCLLLMREALNRHDEVSQFEFGLEILNNLLTKVGIDLEPRAIATICNNLRLCSIFTPTDGTNMYVFSIPQLVNFFEGLNLNWYIDKSARMLKKQNNNWRAVYSDADLTVADSLFHGTEWKT